MKNVILYFL